MTRLLIYFEIRKELAGTEHLLSAGGVRAVLVPHALM